MQPFGCLSSVKRSRAPEKIENHMLVEVMPTLRAGTPGNASAHRFLSERAEPHAPVMIS
jgi:hypothetical protein